MSERSEERLGIWLSPILGALGGSATIGVFVAINSSDWSVLLYALMIGLALTIPNLISAAALGGLCYWALKRWRLANWWIYALAGILCGVVAVFIWSVLINIDNIRWIWSEPGMGAQLAGAGAILGVWTSLTYWLIVRPDRDAPPNPASAAS